MAEGFLVFFRPGECDLNAAAKSLDDYGLTVTRRGDELTAGRAGSPKFRIVLSAEPHVAAEAAEIGEGTPHEAAMRECSARFEVGIDDLETVPQVLFCPKNNVFSRDFQGKSGLVGQSLRRGTRRDQHAHGGAGGFARCFARTPVPALERQLVRAVAGVAAVQQRQAKPSVAGNRYREYVEEGRIRRRI